MKIKLRIFGDFVIENANITEKEKEQFVKELDWNASPLLDALAEVFDCTIIEDNVKIEENE